MREFKVRFIEGGKDPRCCGCGSMSHPLTAKTRLCPHCLGLKWHKDRKRFLDNPKTWEGLCGNEDLSKTLTYISMKMAEESDSAMREEIAKVKMGNRFWNGEQLIAPMDAFGGFLTEIKETKKPPQWWKRLTQGRRLLGRSRAKRT